MVKGRIVRLFDAALVGGQSHVDYLRGLGFPQDRVFSGYDVVDNEYFARNTVAVRQNSAALRHDLNLPERFFLAAARFVPRKNLDRLLTAYAAYRKTAGPDAWKLVLLGDGPLRAELEAARGSLRLTNEVLMPGFIQYPELPKYYGLAGAFIHASSTEQWGLVVNEAMASGLPVIVSKSCGCARELVREGENGFTFDPRDTRRLADLILNLAASAEERREAMGQSSREIIKAFSPSQFAEGAQRAREAAKETSHRTLNLVSSILLKTLTSAV
jgi:glycosyltransferase involved in cell wall biosynthesis